MLEEIKKEVLGLLKEFLKEKKLDQAETCAHIYRCLQDRVQEFKDIPTGPPDEEALSKFLKENGFV